MVMQLKGFLSFQKRRVGAFFYGYVIGVARCGQQ